MIINKDGGNNRPISAHLPLGNVTLPLLSSTVGVYLSIPWIRAWPHIVLWPMTQKPSKQRTENHLCCRKFSCYHTKKRGLAKRRMSPHETEMVCPNWGPINQLASRWPTDYTYISNSSGDQQNYPAELKLLTPLNHWQPELWAIKRRLFYAIKFVDRLLHWAR